MKTIKLIIFACLCIICNANIAQTLAPKAVDSLLRQHFADTNFMILDVCRPSAYASGHIQNAYPFYVDQTDFSTYIDRLDKQKTYLLHCTSGSMSARAINIMKPKGFEHLYELAGGITNWKSNNFEVTTNTKQSKIRIIGTNEFNNVKEKSNSLEIVDLRYQTAFEQKHLIGAIRIDRTKTSLVSLLTDKSKTYCIYGDAISKMDSTQLYDLYKAGYEEIYFLKDGFKSWEDAGLPIYTASSTSLLEEVFSPTIRFTDNQNISFQNTSSDDTFIFYNIQGTVLSEGYCTENISILHLAQGLYFIQIRDYSKINTFKFIK